MTIIEDDIDFPTDDRQSRINRPPKSETPDDFASASDRIEAFWQKYPDGSILTEVESEQAGEYAVYTVRAYIRRQSVSERPDTTAHATRGSYDPEPITAQFPQETAETSAVSRALRNLGILPHGKPTPSAPARVVEEPKDNTIAAAREAAGMSQRKLAEAMRDAGISWSQAVVSKVEKGTRALKDAEAAKLAEIIDFGRST